MIRKPVDKINILFIIIQIDVMGGSERLVYNLAANLDRRLFNPSIAWFYGQDKIADFKKLGIPLYHLPKVKKIDLSTMRRIGQIVRENNIRIVNAHHFMSMVYAFYGCKVMNRAGLVYTEHSEWELERLSRKWRTAGRYLLNRADASIGVSPAVSGQMQKMFKIAEPKIVTILNGVDIQDFDRSRELTYLKKELGITPDEKVISIVANIRKMKNHIFLLKAFHELLLQGRKAKLLLIGQDFADDDSQGTKRKLREFVNEKRMNGSVLFLGYRSDIVQLLHITDVFCLPSYKEGLPISLIEAMAAGLPVIGTNVEGIRDVILPKVNGFLVRVDDTRDLRHALSVLVDSEPLRCEFGVQSRLLAQKNYSLENCIAKYQNIFLKTLGRHRDTLQNRPYLDEVPAHAN